MIVHGVNDVATDIAEKFKALFPAWPTVLATLLAVTVLMVVLTKLVWQPVKKSMRDRTNYIQSNIDNATKKNEIATKNRETSFEELRISRDEAATILSNAKLEASKIKYEAIIESKRVSEIMMQDAKSEIDREKQLFAQNARKEIVDVALEAAKKIVEKEVDTAANKKIIEDFVNSNFS
ncbi:MAG: F0F1 ATP synthase subunit B [Mycoplasma sp.]|nr:F0F1 ATP synthase subunit B [Mycoplasma sp.]